MSSAFEHPSSAPKPPPAVARHLEGAPPADAMSRDALAGLRAASLRAIVERAYEKSPFYRRKMDQARVRPGDVAGLSDLTRLPFLTKDELRGNPWVLLTCDKRDVAMIQVSTGTTGGEEIYMLHTWSDYRLQDLAPRYSTLFPVGPGDVCLNALPYEMSTAGLAFHKTFMDGYHATVIPAGKGGAYSTARKTIKLIDDLRPNIVVTSPSWAVTLAEEAEERSIDLRRLGFKKLWLTGEGCSPSFRRRVEQLWGAGANHFYGSLECGILGIECDGHDGYHVPEAHVILELVDPKTGAPVKAGEVGEIVITALLRYDCPVIRFRTGDLGKVDEAPCACGVTLPRLHLRGRAFDQILFRGEAISPFHLEEALMRIPEVGNWFEFVVPRGDGPSVVVRCELAKGARADTGTRQMIAEKMRAATGLPIEVEIVARLPRPTGKVARVVRS